MKRRQAIFGVFTSLALTLLLPQHAGADDSEFAERDEFRQSYSLGPGAQVEVKGMNGSVTIETANTSTAEVHVVRSARKREDLETRKVIVEQIGNRLVVRGENEDRGWGRKAEVRQQVMLKLPRQIDLSIHGINGSVKSGAIEGQGAISGVNGKVEVAQAGGIAKLSGINGSVSVTVAKLGEQGMTISGINGRVDVQFATDLNAEIHASGINGKVDTDLQMMKLTEWDRSNFKARVGSGGPTISVSGVNGRVSLKKVSG